MTGLSSDKRVGQSLQREEEAQKRRVEEAKALAKAIIDLTKKELKGS
jgi:hypothetical protein